MLYNPGGTPAKNATVYFYRFGADPRTGLAAAIYSTTTDANGNYTAILDSGTYNILASKGGNATFQDSIKAFNDTTVHPAADTLKAFGSISGKVLLQGADDPRTVFVLFMGTNMFTSVQDSLGNFTAPGMAKGKYKVRLLSILDDYKPMDTSFVIKAGIDSVIPEPIRLQYTGIQVPTGLRISYDTLRQIVILAWNGVDTSLISGYNVYRAFKGQNFSLITQTPLPDTVTTYRDLNVSVGNTYAYTVVSLRAGQESQKIATPGDTMKAVSSSLVTTSFAWNLNNTISDTASINDTIKACLTYSNPTRKIVKIVWYADSLNSSTVKQRSDSSLAGKDTLAYSWKQAGNKKIFVKVTDGAGTVWTDSLGVIIIQDVPVIAFLSADTIVNHGSTVRCSVYVQQKFGTMDVEIDTANSGIYKSLGSLGLNGGEKYSFLTDNACAWDSVKVRITDDDGNVLEKGFRVRIRPRLLTITSIDSTVNTITVHFSQTQETDFAKYLIYRNTTNAVDTTSELWAAITSASTVSYMTPTPTYAWMPRYYRVFQKDKEGVLSVGGNVVYGNIVNSPPPTPVITYPANNGDSIWANAAISWTNCLDPNGNGVRYRVLVNYNDKGYTEFKAALVDTFTQFNGYDSLSLKFKVMAYDTLGDSSIWSGERLANLKCADIEGMRFIPGGTFQMGQVGIAEPIHSVTLSAFWIDTTPVTQADYMALMGKNPSQFKGDTKRPVERVSWFDAALYCNQRSKQYGLDTVYSYTSIIWLIDLSKNGYRLPTEAQYEYALRAGTTTKCFWGNDSSAGGNYAWYNYNSDSTTHPVATKLPNPWGLYDMAGNVLEWCSDWYEKYYSAAGQTDPVGPATGTNRVLRGCSWLDTPYYIGIRCADRAANRPDFAESVYGFRCVLFR
jgi:formylglycine-generating enzyme required for sulfatase activity